MGMAYSERLGGHLKRVEMELSTIKATAVKPAGITLSQYATLLVLSEEPGLSGAELARRCLVTPQTMTTILRNLEAAELIERTPHAIHRHVIETRPTPAGRKALERADERAVRVERRLADAFTAEERDTLRELLGRCSEVLTDSVLDD